MNPSTTEIIGTVLFALAVTHTFLAGKFKALGHKYPEGSIPENLFHLLGETEVVFGLWAGFLFFGLAFTGGWSSAVGYIDAQTYTEPLFVTVIMTIAATRPVLVAAEWLIKAAAKVIPGLPKEASFYFSCLVMGPLLGSFITEPAAMTIVALLLAGSYYKYGLSRRAMYITLAFLFVNVSIGGTLTNFAAPPVLMVKAKWGWSTAFMLGHFGWKAAIAVFMNAALATYLVRGDLRGIKERREVIEKAASVEYNPETSGQLSAVPMMKNPPLWLIALHLLAMVFVVATAHYWKVFLGGFVFTLGLVKVTWEYQERPRIIESLLVGFFLAGLVTFGGLQKWWLEPVIMSMDSFVLFVGTTGLTAVTDNAALTLLGSQVDGLSDTAKYALVAGAVAGGGLTLIANAPNPAGYSILKAYFEDKKEGKDFSPLGLLLAALVPTVIAMALLWLTPQ